MGRDSAMFVFERLVAAVALFIAAHFAMGFINPSAGGTGGNVLFPFATDAPSPWVLGGLDGMLGLLVPVMIGLAGIAVLTFFLAFLATIGVSVPADLWRPLILVGAACSVALLSSIRASTPRSLWRGTQGWHGSPGLRPGRPRPDRRS